MSYLNFKFNRATKGLLNDILRFFGILGLPAVAAFIIYGVKDNGHFAESNQGASAPLVVLYFDDGCIEELTTFAPLLDTLGAVANTAIVSDWVGGVNRLDWDDIRTLQNVYGWEICSHSKTHANLTTLKKDSLIVELAESKASLEAQGLHVSNLAYPYNAQNSSVRRIASQYYRSGRTQGAFGINNTRVDSYALNSIDIDVAGNLHVWLESLYSAIENHQLLILFGHANSVNPFVLTTFINFVHSKGVSIVTIDQALDIIGIDKHSN